MDRRSWFKWLIRGFGAVVTAGVGLPIVATVLSPNLRERAKERWRPLGPVDSFPVGVVRQATVELAREDRSERLRQQGVFVYRRGPSEIVVFSRSCTDLSCPVTHDAGSEWFFCPCHGAIFNREGEPVAGPASRPLYRYEHRVREGVLEIDLQSVPPLA